ncbi:hypothetical protein GOP47_0007278 [Adiantum capillus-veneris]|uniref:BLUF domain-containing protein n=1 Tax=Adiantum capillus-veneris TaxID=13818 RepID=A0A9D4ZJ57_ADICA|nr:hypothetical protein GOP47_0007278 [Adiantum capillus-veneris]
MDSIPGTGFSSTINTLSVNRRTTKRIVSRVMYAAKTVNKETSKQHLLSYHSENLQKVVGKADKITGFLLIYPTCCLHVLEGDTTSLMAILRSLQADASLLESICVLSFTEDVTYRFFPSWMAGFINASNLGPYEPKNSKNLLSEISSLNINVLKWGKKLSEMDKVQQAQALDSVRSSTEEFLPDDPAAIFAFILADETPKLDEFLDIYDLPPKDIIFDNDILLYGCVANAQRTIQMELKDGASSLIVQAAYSKNKHYMEPTKKSAVATEEHVIVLNDGACVSHTLYNVEENPLKDTFQLQLHILLL